MKKLFITLGVLIAIGLAWYLGSPLFLDKEVNESLEDLVAEHESEFGEVDGLKELMLPEAQPEKPEETPETTTEDETVSQPEEPIVQPQPVPATAIGTGTFEGLDNHNASGKATVISINATNYIRLEDDFAVTNGPDLYVGLGKNGTYGTEVARLKGNIGGQNYQVPDTIDLNQYNEVWIWCKRFSVPFGKAAF